MTTRDRNRKVLIGVFLLLATIAVVWQFYVRVILQRPAALNMVLIGAILHGDADRVHSLLSQGASANARLTPFSLRDLMAESPGTQPGGQAPGASNAAPTVLALVLNLDEFGHPMLSDATTARIARDLLDHGADIRTSDMMSSRDMMGSRALWRASALGYYDTAKLLLDRGANVNAVNEDGSTAIIAALGTGKDALLRLLTERGADVNARVYGSTALMWACAHKDVDLGQITWLLDRGAKVNATTPKGGTALMIAATSGRSDVARLLLDHGAQIDARNNDGRTPLMFAAKAGKPGVVRILLARGANARLKNRHGETALAQARTLTAPEGKEIIRLLRAAGAKQYRP